MANTYRRQGLIGGTAGALDALDGAALAAGDFALTTDATLALFYFHKLNPSSGVAESSPNVIEPDTNAGNKRWELCGVWAGTYNNLTLLALATGFSVAGGTTSKTLTIEETCTIDQDLSTTSTPTFDGLTSTGDVEITGDVDVTGGLSLTDDLALDTGVGIDFDGQLLNTFVDLTDWTPVVKIGGADTGITYTTHVGSYCTIGSVVFVNGYIVLSSKGALTGVVTIEGFPYTIADADKYYSAISISMFAGILFTGQVSMVMLKNTATASLTISLEAGGVTQVANTHITDTFTLNFSGMYFVSQIALA